MLLLVFGSSCALSLVRALIDGGQRTQVCALLVSSFVVADDCQNHCDCTMILKLILTMQSLGNYYVVYEFKCNPICSTLTEQHSLQKIS